MRQLKRYSSLDFWKGICIIFIIITHFIPDKSESRRYFFPFWIDMAVPIFMIITGFISAKSFEDKKMSTFAEMYGLDEICRKMIRFTMPFIMAFLGEVIIYGLIYRKRSLALLSVLHAFFLGGNGPGGYYYPVMIQMIFVIPIVYSIIRRHDYVGLLICWGLNFIYEFIFQFAYGMDEDVYRLIGLRYIFIVGCGCFWAIGRHEWKRWVKVVCFTIGLIYILTFSYSGYSPLITSKWTGTSFIACMFIVPISKVFLLNDKCKFQPLEWIGKASYNIFLVQKIYYDGMCEMVYRNILSRGIQLLINIVICVIIGLLFYFVEISVTKWAIAIIRRMIVLLRDAGSRLEYRVITK